MLFHVFEIVIIRANTIEWTKWKCFPNSNQVSHSTNLKLTKSIDTSSRKKTHNREVTLENKSQKSTSVAVPSQRKNDIFLKLLATYHTMYRVGALNRTRKLLILDRGSPLARAWTCAEFCLLRHLAGCLVGCKFRSSSPHRRHRPSKDNYECEWDWRKFINFTTTHFFSFPVFFLFENHPSDHVSLDWLRTSHFRRIVKFQHFPSSFFTHRIKLRNFIPQLQGTPSESERSGAARPQRVPGQGRSRRRSTSAPPRTQNLRAVHDVSVDLLDPDVVVVFVIVCGSATIVGR